MKKNMFPEPSPAACGSRKVIELAAAKMLAAVGNAKGLITNTTNTTNSNSSINTAAATTATTTNSSSTNKPTDDFSGKATPPPSNSIKDHGDKEVNGVIGGSAGKGMAVGGTKRPAPGPGRLQIVNPEALGVVNEGNGAKRRNMGQEPTTPWDGQLEALGR